MLKPLPRTRFAFPLLAYAFAAIMLGTTLPTPIYAIYADELHFSVLTTTVIYATYAGGVLFTLVVFGRWSDAIGRRPVLLAGVACALASDVIFLVRRLGPAAAGGTRGVRVLRRTVRRYRDRRGHRGGAARVASPRRLGRDRRQHRRAGHRPAVVRLARRIRAQSSAAELPGAHRAGRACRGGGGVRARDVVAQWRPRRAAGVGTRRSPSDVRHRRARRVRGIRGDRPVHRGRAVLPGQRRRHRQPRGRGSGGLLDLRGVGGRPRWRRRTSARTERWRWAARSWLREW